MIEPFSRRGAGVHTGASCAVRVEPAPPGTGVVFETARGALRAVAGSIDPASRRATDLRDGSVRVRTVEHLLAALVWFGELDVTIAIDGPEIPIVDGSAAPWAASLLAAGATPGPRFVAIAEPVQVSVGESTASLTPLPPDRDPLLAVELKYEEPVAIGSPRVAFRPTADDFVSDFAPARTFALASEVDQIRAAGLGLGGSLDNAVIIGENGPLNPCGCRFPDEPGRHKLVDAIGDLSLLGGIPWAAFEAVRPGHRLLHELVRRARVLD
jgi:UDP-3-O-[3-hydroxymyristoyl] N-acetylglucosamine deacetylase